MINKVCFKCGLEKELSEFYKHKRMADGHLNKCIDCTKSDSLKNRWNNIDKIREYDRQRGYTEKRISINTQKTKVFRKNNPEKYKAHTALNNAVRDGRVKKEPCLICRTIDRIESHHEDYSKPLDVVWLCSVHHSAIHHNLMCLI